MRKLDLSLYCVLDPTQTGGRSLPDIAEEARAGGATLFQLRDKTGTTRAQIDCARAIRDRLADRAPLLIDDRADVAFAADAEGVHIGHGDLTPEEANAMLGPDALLGLTIHTMQEAETADLALVDYASVGGVFATASKHNPHPPIGIEGFRAITARLRERRPGLPVCAIAGITLDRIADLVEAGADGVAVVSAISKAPSMADAARTLRFAVEDARRAPRRLGAA